MLSNITVDETGDGHLSGVLETPMKKNAFLMSDSDKKEKIAHLFSEIMGLDLIDDSMKGTPAKFTKMYIDEVFSG